MKLTKKIINSEVKTYFKNGVKKYSHFKDSTGYESWAEYDKEEKQIHFKSSDGDDEWWSNEHPDNPNKSEEVDIKPFTFE